MIPSGSLKPGIDPDDFLLPPGTAIRFEQPEPELRALVPSYAVLDSDPSVFTGPSSWLLPGSAQIWIVLTEGVTIQPRKRQPTSLGGAVLYGPSSRAMPATSHGGVTVVIDLAPAGWARLIGRPADALRNQIVPLESIWPSTQAEDLVARLHQSDRAAEVKPVLDEFLQSVLPPAHADEAMLVRFSALLADPGVSSVSNVTEMLGAKSRTLSRMSNIQLGFPPKVLIRRTRFIRALIGIMLADGMPAGGIVPTGYYDYSHFARDAYEFLGMTPRRFLAMRMPYLRSAMLARSLVIGSPWPLLDR